MAEGLAFVPTKGLAFVVTAVQDGVTKGYTRIEPIRPTLTHWQDPDQSALPQINTPDALKLNESPVADTGRYDQRSAVQPLVGVEKESEDAYS
jgi:hypothetical protein